MPVIPLSPTQLSLVGSGLAHPFAFSEDYGGVVGVDAANGLEKIRASIYFVLSTRLGEYPDEVEFGSRIPELLFEPVVVAERLVVEARERIGRWVPQIQLLNVYVFLGDPNAGLVWLSGDYQVRNTPVRGSFVVPFFVPHGALVA